VTISDSLCIIHCADMWSYCSYTCCKNAIRCRRQSIQSMGAKVFYSF